MCPHRHLAQTRQLVPCRDPLSHRHPRWRGHPQLHHGTGGEGPPQLQPWPGPPNPKQELTTPPPPDAGVATEVALPFNSFCALASGLTPQPEPVSEALPNPATRHKATHF